jgi:hypothetical protein
MSRNPSKLGSVAGYFAALTLLLLSALSLWLDNQELLTSGSIIYSALGMNLLFWGKCLTVPLAWVCIFLWTKGNSSRLERWKFYIAISIFLILFLVLASTHYVFAWGGSSLSNVDTAQFEGDTYHLVKRVQFDVSSKYYLGRCTFPFQCNFHQIFVMNSHYRPDTISLDVDQNFLSIVVDSELVFTYDGFQESCIDRDLVYCP